MRCGLATEDQRRSIAFGGIKFHCISIFFYKLRFLTKYFNIFGLYFFRMTAVKKNHPRQKYSDNFAQHNEALEPNEVASRRLGNILAQSLAAYVLLRSKEPVCEVIQDLFEIESAAATLVDAFCADQEKITSLRGTLVSVFSFVPVGRGQSIRDVTPKKAAALRSVKGRKKNSPNSRKKRE